MNLRRTIALIWKEFLQIIRDPSSLFMAFGVPLVLLLFFGYGISLDMNNVKFNVVLEDQGAEARRLALQFIGSPNFHPDISLNKEQALNDVAKGFKKGAIIVPNGFSEKLNYSGKSGVSPSFQIVTDGSFPNAANLVQTYALSLVQQWMAEEGAAGSPVSIAPRFWYNNELESLYVVVPELISTVLSLVGTMLTAMVVAREWERGSMESILSTPVNTMEILMGKLIPYYVLGVGSAFTCLAVSKLLFGVPFRGSILMMFCCSSLFMLSNLSIGLIISSLTKNQYAASMAAMMLSFLPNIFFSGGVFEISSMPFIQRFIATILPAKYYTTCIMSLFLAGDVMELLIPNMLILALMALVTIIVMLKTSSNRIG